MSKEKGSSISVPFDEKLAAMRAKTDDYDSTYQFIELNLDGIDKLTLNKELFKKGIDSVSETCGAICALSNIGVSPESAMAFLASKYEIDMTYKMQLDLSDDINRTSIEVAKLSGEAQLKQQI